MILNRSTAKIDIEHCRTTYIHCKLFELEIVYKQWYFPVPTSIWNKIKKWEQIANTHIHGWRERESQNEWHIYDIYDDVKWSFRKLNLIGWDIWMCVRFVYWIWHGHCILILILNNIKRSMLLPRELSFVMYCEFATDTIPYYSYNLQIVGRFLAFAPSYSISWIKLIDVNQIYEEWGKTIRNHERTIH